MDELEQQIEAWGDATMERSDRPVTASEVRDRNRLDRPALTDVRGSGRRWALGAAAAMVALAAMATVVVGVRNDGPEEVRTAAPEEEQGSDAPGTSGPGPDGQRLSGEVTFEVLAMGRALMRGVGSFDGARTAEELAGVWADAGQPPPVPDVNFDERVVLSITIPDDACPPELVAFDRLDGEVEGLPVVRPRFVEPTGGCRSPLIPKTYVVALDWKSMGDDFFVRIPGQPAHDYDDSNFRVARGDVNAQGQWLRPPADGLPDISRLVMRAGIQASLIDSIPYLEVAEFGPDGEPGRSAFAITLPNGAGGTLSWFEITARRPEDTRAGLDRPTTVGTPEGGVVTVGVPPDTSVALRFDCHGVRYQLAAPTGPSQVLAVVDALSSELGCEPPTTSAPTECLGLPDDPIACTED